MKSIGLLILEKNIVSHFENLDFKKNAKKI